MGCPLGIFSVGYCYYRGIGVRKNERNAFIHFKKSVDIYDVNGILLLST